MLEVASFLVLFWHIQTPILGNLQYLVKFCLPINSVLQMEGIEVMWILLAIKPNESKKVDNRSVIPVFEDCVLPCVLWNPSYF